MKKASRKLISFEFNQVHFPSQGSDIYRVKVNSLTEGVLFWVESKKSKQQWQCTVTNIADCGPSGVPEEAILAFLERALSNVSDGIDESKLDVNEPTTDLPNDGGEVALVLKLSMGGIWRPEFVFALLPVGLEKVDVLEAKVRDAQEEIEFLRMEAEHQAEGTQKEIEALRNLMQQHAESAKKDIDALRAQLLSSRIKFFSTSSTTACPNQQIVVWGPAAPFEIAATHFAQSDDKKQVRILVAGVYEVYVRLAGTNTANTQHLGLQKNGEEYAQCTQSDGNSHQNTPQIQEVMRLAVGDVLQVRCGANQASLQVAHANRFTIKFIGI